MSIQQTAPELIETLDYPVFAAWVRAGVIEFFESALPDQNHLCPLLLEEQIRLCPASQGLSWIDLNRQVAELWSEHQFDIISDFQLNTEHSFLLILLGEMQQSHLLNLMVHKLQSPNDQHWLTVHLALSILEFLFQKRIQPLQLVNTPLLTKNLLQISGDGPLPLHQLSIDTLLWSAVVGESCLWFVKPLTVIPEQEVLIAQDTKSQVLNATQLYSKDERQHLRGFVIEGDPLSGRKITAALIAQHLELTPVLWTEQQWHDHPCPELVCKYQGWLPVIQPELTLNAIWAMPKFMLKWPMVVIVPSQHSVDEPAMLTLVTKLPCPDQRLTIWQRCLAQAEPSFTESLAATLLLHGPNIQLLSNQAQALADLQRQSIDKHHLLQIRQMAGAEKLSALANLVTRKVDKNALVVPDYIHKQLQSFLSRAKQRQSLWKQLGSTLKAAPSNGIRGLFSGGSGTGKTLAASYIATELAMPLYRVDLSSVMNKYIGETEKNLSQLLQYAAAYDVVLLFDEADSMFGSRTEGKDTGDRFANMMTNFLLTKIENHPGVVLLTTNGRERIDDAFNRRIDLIIEFPAPGFEQRRQLWHSHLGERFEKPELINQIASHCDFSGGQIRNAVIAAAVESQGHSISPQQLQTGLEFEYQKIGRSLPGTLNTLLQQGAG